MRRPTKRAKAAQARRAVPTPKAGWEAADKFYGQLEEKARARTPKGTLVETLPLWNQGTRIGGQLTPQAISLIIRDADSGDICRLMDLANECKQQDCHLQAVLGTDEQSIAGLPFQIVAPNQAGGKPRAKDKRAAAWVEEKLRACAGLPVLISNMAGGHYYGYSCDEIIWRKVEGRSVPDRFVHIAQRRFRFRTSDGQIVLADSGKGELDLQKAYPNKFIVFQPRINGDTPNREGLCRPLIWMSCMRRWTIGDWLHTGEMSWKPWRIGTYKQTAAGLKDREALETIMRRMTTDHTAVIPDSTNIAIEWPGGSNSGRSTHAELVNMLGQEMSKAVLGQTETTQASASSGYAQAKVHDVVRRDLREARAKEIADALTTQLIEPMIRLNFGDSVAVPRFEFITQDPVDLKAFSEALANLVKTGMKIPQAWAQAQAGVPEPKGDEPILEAPKPTPIAPPTPPGAKPPAGNKPEPEAPLPSDDGATPADEKPETEDEE